MYWNFACEVVPDGALMIAWTGKNILISQPDVYHSTHDSHWCHLANIKMHGLRPMYWLK